jgi:hypothetical protein
MVNLGIASTAEDFRQCVDLLGKTHPGDPLPLFGQPNNVTFITWDSDEGPDVIRGVIHCRIAPEVTHMAADPDYRFQQASYALLHQFAEGHLRIAGHRCCDHVVPKAKDRIVKMLRKCGSVIVGENDIRLRKEL